MLKFAILSAMARLDDHYPNGKGSRMELAGKIAFITGGGGGIGGGMAEAFAENGMKIVLADIDLDQAQQQAAALPAGTDALAIQLDVTSLDSWAAARQAALDRFGQVDVLCNNAGISVPWQPLVDVPPEDFERAIRINLFGVYYGVKTFGPDMIARKSGHICNTSSMNGLIAPAMMAPYSASKFAVTALTDSLRDEMAPHGVGVSALYPGLTRSNMSLATSQLDKAAVMPKSMRMMEPVWLGRAVVAAIQNGPPHIISHPDHKAAVQARFASVLDCFGEPAEPGYPQRD
jgi:NAD(P)-dependent dehydrogenase (short-subunit alcohol dehydrogenase family)